MGDQERARRNGLWDGFAVATLLEAICDLVGTLLDSLVSSGW